MAKDFIYEEDKDFTYEEDKEFVYGEDEDPTEEEDDSLDFKQGPRGERGEKGPTGAPGLDGKPGKDGKAGRDGTNGRDGKQGSKGDRGEAGKNGKDGVDGKSLDFKWEGTSLGVKRSDQKDFKFSDLGGSVKDGWFGSSRTYRLNTSGSGTSLVATTKANAATLKGLAAGSNITLTDNGTSVTINSSGGGSSTETFETVSKNIKGYPSVLNYTLDVLTHIIYTLPSGSITKTFGYTGDQLTSVTLSGDTPSGIDLIKTLTYTGDSLTSISYS